MIDTKRIGRPKKLDRDDILLRAINVFWEYGYEGASMKHLTDAIGVKSPSLYADFGDKRGLYLEAIDKYVNNDACAPLVALEQETDIQLAIQAFYEAAIDYSTQHESGAKGCFLVSCVSTTAGHLEGIDDLLQSAIKQTDLRITARFEKAKALGQLPENFPSEQKARLLFDLRQGLVFRARSGISDSALKQDLAARVAMIMSE